MPIPKTINGYLFSYMDTNVPGFRSVDVGSTTLTMPAGYWDFREYISRLDTLLDPEGWDVLWYEEFGLVQFFGRGDSEDLTFNDRMGEYLGFRAPPESVLPGSDNGPVSYYSVLPPPGCLHLLGAMWESVDIERERVIETTRTGRGYGYVWGGAKMWRWKLQIAPTSVQGSVVYKPPDTVSTEHDPSLYTTSKPILSNFVSKGKVELNMGTDGAIAAAEMGGALTGWVIGMDGIRQSSSFGYTSYEATLLVAGAVS